jgi:hypothetical protein
MKAGLHGVMPAAIPRHSLLVPGNSFGQRLFKPLTRAFLANKRWRDYDWFVRAILAAVQIPNEDLNADGDLDLVTKSGYIRTCFWLHFNAPQCASSP